MKSKTLVNKRLVDLKIFGLIFIVTYLKYYEVISANQIKMTLL
jgi:hypothetical protein